ncbi:MAG TPA: hypothetical protein VE057_25215 [Archangium sp.]|nr:hypothetical protein [Archangium sp.]
MLPLEGVAPEPEAIRTTDKAVVSVDAMRQSAKQLRSTTARLTEALSGFRL